MVQKIEFHETLADKAKRWGRALVDEATGALTIASEIVKLSEEWETFRAEAGGVDCTTWLRKEVSRGRGLPFWHARAEAVAALGESVRRFMHHEVAVWLKNKTLSDEQLERAKFILKSEMRKNANKPLNRMQAHRALRDVLGITPAKSRVCERCQELEELLRAKGIEIP